MRCLYKKEAGLAKKDDDHHKPVRTAKRRPSSSSWQTARGPRRRLLKRIGLGFIVIAFLYLFVHNIPVLGPDERMRRPVFPHPKQPNDVQPIAQGMRPMNPDTQGGTALTAPERNFNGPFAFPKLGYSLKVFADYGGNQSPNKNVLFVAANLKSAGTLLPVACQMGTELKNYVHFALLGRSSMSLERLAEINGIDKSCAIIYHDARPDHAAVSIDERLEKSVLGALHQIDTHLRPQAIILDGSDVEEALLTKGVRQHVKMSETTLIELPQMDGHSLSWMTKLDATALRMWNKIKIDIVIQATPKSMGSLTRLLMSLRAADYSAGIIPRITVELPHHVDSITQKFLDLFTWPPGRNSNPANERYISFRRRLWHKQTTEEEASTRFFESFWPTQPHQSHVLILSPHVEVAPQFFQYLRYVLLEYYYSADARLYNWGRHLFGISLEQPLATADHKLGVMPPLFKHPEDVNNENGGTPNPYLWQSPPDNAVLFLGEKWMELHDFVSRTMQATDSFTDVPGIISEKTVSKKHPSWLEHALRLARVRGYTFLYPGLELVEHLVNIHIELEEPPEEYAGSEDIHEIRKKIRKTHETQLSSLSLLDSLPNNGNLWPLSALPLMTWDGTEIDPSTFHARADDFARLFKEQVGGCDVKTGKGQKPQEPASAQDLFCKGW